MIKVYSSPYVNGEPLSYMVSSTDSDTTIPANVLVVQTSTAVGFGAATASTSLNNVVRKYFITMKATTGSTSTRYPVQEVRPDVFYKVDHSTAEAVVGTSAQGYLCLVSSSGAATVASTGGFRIHAVHNTSDTSAQYFVGKFVFRSTAEL